MWPFSKKKSTYKRIEELLDEHKRINEKANELLDLAIASLDGETGWLVCECKESTEKKKEPENNGPLPKSPCYHSNT